MDEINRVARMMVDAEPAVDLAARIRARLDQVQRHGRAPSWWRVAVPLGAVASLALAIGFAVQGPGSRVQGLPAVAHSAEAGPEVQGPESRVQGPSDSSPFRTLPPLRHYSGAQRSSVSALSMEESAWMERRIAALEPVDALRMEHLTYESIQPEALSITPLLLTAMRTDGADIDRQNNR
ncbi:MAG: hypothetical protein IPL75_15085 [Acidobacteria bacterium]|nr:hypothetical protein [Acidobacteriota bacterium]